MQFKKFYKRTVSSNEFKERFQGFLPHSTSAEILRSTSPLHLDEGLNGVVAFTVIG